MASQSLLPGMSGLPKREHNDQWTVSDRRRVPLRWHMWPWLSCDPNHFLTSANPLEKKLDNSNPHRVTSPPPPPTNVESTDEWRATMRRELGFVVSTLGGGKGGQGVVWQQRDGPCSEALLYVYLFVVKFFFRGVVRS